MAACRKSRNKLEAHRCPAGSAWSVPPQQPAGTRSWLVLASIPLSLSSWASTALSTVPSAPSTLSACGRQLQRAAPCPLCCAARGSSGWQPGPCWSGSGPLQVAWYMLGAAHASHVFVWRCHTHKQWQKPLGQLYFVCSGLGSFCHCHACRRLQGSALANGRVPFWSPLASSCHRHCLCCRLQQKL